MDISDIITIVSQQKACTQLIKALNSVQNKEINLSNLKGSAISTVAAASVKACKGVHFFIMNDSDEAGYLYNDLFHLLQTKEGKIDQNKIPDKVLFLPSSYKRSSKYGREDSSNIVQRTQVLEQIKDHKEWLVVVSFPEAMAETVPSEKALAEHILNVQVNEKISLDFLREVLHTYGFQRSDFVYEPGQYAVRGGIIDVFSFASNEPFRIELFGNEVESIRKFDINTQLSADRVSKATIVANIRDIQPQETRSSIFQYMPSNARIWSQDITVAQQIIDHLIEINLEKNKLKTDESDLGPAIELIAGVSYKNQLSPFQNIRFNNNTSTGLNIVFETISQPTFNKNFDLLIANLLDMQQQGYLLVILAESHKQIERIRNIFNSKQVLPIQFQGINVSLHEGFIDNQAKICCYTDHQIFQRYHAYRIRGTVSKATALTIQELTSLNVGDFIVHIDHGVGVFGGLINTEINGKLQEVIRLTYQDNDTIFVDLQGLHRISKFRGKDASPPKVYKLGSGAWSKLKNAAKKKIKDIAQELIALYAQRKSMEGFAFAPDSYLQHELEASFIYEDTPDQFKTTKAVKADMELPQPMDRLVCGDVGFGKTEIAIRAAFKAATDGKQVAVLVPTTILALQHFKSFSQRLNDFPVNIDFISRMKSTKEIKASLANAAAGKTDILIGTHRLLSKDVVFNDLGLLVIDEEQRFGVGAKEKIKHLRVNVDTLTLTATPIPRTLQFSLMGARDLSIINTPPPNRLPINTEVHTFSELIIKDAIDLEVQRGGQIFFIHNRIKDIHNIAQMIQRLCPHVRTIVAHGQMEGDVLEDIMTDFVDAEYDVLVATTIIESGLDIPNANTIIINQAQNFGLSELHQLRGRVGRSNKKAYCYLLAPPSNAMTNEAQRRLRAIEEFSDLGSGFQIAMQDLDIRGAGNLLGGEQSGFITEIGYETYQRILAEAMMELREEQYQTQQKLPEGNHPIVPAKVPDALQFVTDCYIETDLNLCFPDSYIVNKAEKLRLYRELDGLENMEKLTALKLQLIDRFGPIPKEASELIQSVRLRSLALQMGFEKVKLKNNILLLYFVYNKKSAYYSSVLFINLVKKVQVDPKFRIKEIKDRLQLGISNITSIDQAVEVVEKLAQQIQ